MTERIEQLTEEIVILYDLLDRAKNELAEEVKKEKRERLHALKQEDFLPRRLKYDPSL